MVCTVPFHICTGQLEEQAGRIHSKSQLLQVEREKMQMELSHKRARIELEKAANTNARNYEVRMTDDTGLSQNTRSASVLVFQFGSGKYFWLFSRAVLSFVVLCLTVCMLGSFWRKLKWKMQSRSKHSAPQLLTDTQSTEQELS